jgi:hypothetical protein
MMYLKKYTVRGDSIIAVCDEELIGKEFHEKGITLDISDIFYKGELVSKTGVIEALSHATIANLVGKRSVECAIKNGFIYRENVMKIGGVPHAQMVRMLR